MEFRAEYSLLGQNYGHIYYSQPEENETGFAQQEISDFCFDLVKDKYGDTEGVTDRLEQELNFVEETGSAFQFLILKEVSEAAKEEDTLLLSSGIGSPFIEYLLGASPVNPLPPHYYCSFCKHIDFTPEVKDGYDLPLKKCPVCGNWLHRDGHNCSSYMHQYDRGGRIKWPSIAIRTSNKVFGKLEEILDKSLNRRDFKTNTIYRSMEFISFWQGGLLKKLSNAADVSNREIEVNEKTVWAAVAREQYKECPYDWKHLHGAEQAFSFNDLIRIMGCQVATYLESGDQPVVYPDPFYITKDEIFEELLKIGYSAADAAIKANRICRGRECEVSCLPADIQGNMRSIRHIWSRKNCINRIYPYFYLKWFETFFPEEYKSVTAQKREDS